MKSLIEVYNKFKHLDKLLSSMSSDNDSGDGIRAYDVCRELWMAIKAAQVPDMPIDKPFIDLGDGTSCGSCLKRFCTCIDRVSGRMSGQYPPVINPADTVVSYYTLTDYVCPRCDVKLFKDKIGNDVYFYGCEKCRLTYRVDEVEAPGSKYTKHGPPEADLTAGNSQAQTGSKKSEVK